jgi:hypothetical protein
MEQDHDKDAEFFDTVLRRYVEAVGALHPDQARRDFFTYAQEVKGLREADARQWAKLQLGLLVTRAAAMSGAGS